MNTEDTMTYDTLRRCAFTTPAVHLAGLVDQAMYASFRNQLDSAPAEGPWVVEMTTLGGDPEVARAMGEDIRLHGELDPDRRIVFLGKAAVYSAGATFMSFFARGNRYLTRGTRLMIHERTMDCSMDLQGPLTSCVASVEAKLNELKASIRIQDEGFESLVRDSSVTVEDVRQRAPSNWYVEASEAAELGLIEAVI